MVIIPNYMAFLKEVDKLKCWSELGQNISYCIHIFYKVWYNTYIAYMEHTYIAIQYIPIPIRIRYKSSKIVYVMLKYFIISNKANADEQIFRDQIVIVVGMEVSNAKVI